jgi:hypothetical protein
MNEKTQSPSRLVRTSASNTRTRAHRPIPHIILDDLLTPAEFAAWLGESENWVRRRLASLPGVIRESRKHIRIHPRTYVEKRLKFQIRHSLQ